MSESDLKLMRKYTFSACGQKLVLVKKPLESLRHVTMKALLWALYLPMYPDLQVEVPIGIKYKPDLVQTGAAGPRFWAEAGSIGAEKLRRIVKRFSQTHFALAVWDSGLGVLESRVRRQIDPSKRLAPVDLIRFPDGADRRFIDARGRIDVSHDRLEWRRITG